MEIAEFIQCNSANYTAGRGGKKITEMVVHYTATTASAHNNLVYFSRAGAGASAHLFVDKDGTICQSVNFSDTAWAVGNFARNQTSVSIECVSAGEEFSAEQIMSLASIYQYLLDTYQITDVIRHYDVTGKLCPAPYVDASKWAELKAMIMEGDTLSATDVWSYTNEKINGEKDAYALLTSAANPWSYENEKINGEKDAYALLTAAANPWTYTNENINGDKDVYALITTIYNTVQQLAEDVAALKAAQ